MNDNRHEKAWNDPPLFSLDQMSRATNPTVISRRNRYPQQSAPNQSMNPMNEPMISGNPQNYHGTNPMSDSQSYGQTSQQNSMSYGQPLQPRQQQQNIISNQSAFGQELHQPNAGSYGDPHQQQHQFQSNPRQPSYGQPQQHPHQQPNQMSNHNYAQPLQQQQQTNGSALQSDYPFDTTGFLGLVQALINSGNHLPQELVFQWQKTQNLIYGFPIEGQTKSFLQSIYSSLQTKDLNNCRYFCNYLANDSNEGIRAFGSVLNQIFRYFP